MNFKPRQFSLLLFTYLATRLFSFYFEPNTPLHTAHPLNTFFTLIIISATAVLLFKKDLRGWYIIAAEFILGGGGGYLQIGGISLRTILLITAVSIFVSQKIITKTTAQVWLQNKKFSFSIALLIITVLFGSLRGLLNNHALTLIFSDAVPYLFLFYYFPLRELLLNQKFKSFIWNALFAALAGNLLLVAYTFTTFSAGLHVLQDSYYHWYRDVAGGKITELPFHFYRLVLNEHLLLPALFTVFAYFNLENKTRDQKILLLVSTASILLLMSVNLTRIYFLAFAIGYIALFRTAIWFRWLIHGSLYLLSFILIFTTVHLAASRGQSLGLELFGLRLQSITAPAIEDSSLSRLLLLPKILEKIKYSPLLGTGLGDTITVYSPVLKQTITTPHLDWGYLEILAELGLVGALAWLYFLTVIFYYHHKTGSGSLVLSSLVTLLVCNLTSPALFHVFGITWLAGLNALLQHYSAPSPKI